LTEIATLALCCAFACSLASGTAAPNSAIAKQALAGRIALRGKRFNCTKSSRSIEPLD
jgi:hypothetical protein